MYVFFRNILTWNKKGIQFPVYITQSVQYMQISLRTFTCTMFRNKTSLLSLILHYFFFVWFTYCNNNSVSALVVTYSTENLIRLIAITLIKSLLL